MDGKHVLRYFASLARQSGSSLLLAGSYFIDMGTRKTLSVVLNCHGEVLKKQCNLISSEKIFGIVFHSGRINAESPILDTPEWSLTAIEFGHVKLLLWLTSAGRVIRGRFSFQRDQKLDLLIGGMRTRVF